MLFGKVGGWLRMVILDSPTCFLKLKKFIGFSLLIFVFPFRMDLVPLLGVVLVLL
jgi:hypothetical protein